MTNTRGNSTAPKPEKRWLTVQISEAQNTLLEVHCSKQNQTKATVIRNIINNLDLYEKFLDQVKQDYLGKVSS